MSLLALYCLVAFDKVFSREAMHQARCADSSDSKHSKFMSVKYSRALLTLLSGHRLQPNGMRAGKEHVWTVNITKCKRDIRVFVHSPHL